MQAQPDADYVEYVRARQGQLLRAAHLVCGDRETAASALDRSLVWLALSWNRLRSEDPDAAVRRRLYREAISASRREPDAPQLMGLTPHQRALVVLQHFEERTESEAAEVLGWRIDRVRDQTREALAMLGGATAATARLHGMAGQLPEVAFAESAWTGALQTVRRRRRAASGSVAGVVVVGVVAGGVLSQDDGRQEIDLVPPTPPVTQTDGYRRTFSDIPYVLAPEVGTEPGLMGLQSRLPLVVPAQAPTPGAWDWPGDRPLVAVLLTPLQSTRRHGVVLLGPDGVAVRVPSLSLEATRTVEGGGQPLSASAVSPDGRTVVFPQPGRVLLLTVTTGRVRSVRIPDSGLQRAGWSADGSRVVVGTDRQSWTVDPETLDVRSLAQAAPPGEFTIAGSGVPRPFLQSWNGAGEYVGVMSLPLAPELVGSGDTVGSDPGWAGRAVSLVPDIPASSDGGRPGEGLVAVQAGDQASVRLLLFGRSDERPQACCRAVAWKGRVLLFTSRTREGLVDLLGWDVGSGEVLRVSRLPHEAIALGPGL